MSDTAHGPVVLPPLAAFDRHFFELAGRAALELGARPKFKFAVLDGGRRMLGPKTDRPAPDLKLVGKES
ncbi:MAG: hypothetical protein WAK55_00835 [Xanthobacteraceae bacterium]